MTGKLYYYGYGAIRPGLVAVPIRIHESEPTPGDPPPPWWVRLLARVLSLFR